MANSDIPRIPKSRPDMGMNKPLGKETSPEQKEAMGRLGNLFGGGKSRQKPYMPVLEALETIGIEPKFMSVMIGDESVQCLVVPTQDLVYKEWQYLTASKFAVQPLGEEPE